MVILFFYGDCGLCNRAVVHLSSEQTDAPYHSLLVLAGSAVYEKAGALKILAGELKNPLGYVAQIGLNFSPNSVVNTVYEFVVRNRHRVSSFSCALHTGRALQSRTLP